MHGGPRPRDDDPSWIPWLAAAATGALALLVYAWLAPSVSGDRDSSEFTLVLALDGVAHPTGYPLYTLLGHGFVTALHRLGVGWAYGANLWSALGGAVALALMVRLGARLVPADAPLTGFERHALPLVPAALMLVNPAWTQVTTVAEVYSWHQAWVMGMALLFLDAIPGTAATDHGARSGHPGIAVWGLMVGIGLAHHATSGLLVAVLSLTLAWVRWPGSRRASRHVAIACLASLPPLATSLLILSKARHPGPATWPALGDTWSGLWAHLTGAQYRGVFGRFAPEPMDRALILGAVLPFLLPGLVALVVAAVRAPRGPMRAAMTALLTVAVGQTIFAFLYGVDDPSAYFLPALGLGLVAVVPLMARIAVAAPAGRQLARVTAGALMALALVLAIPWVRQERAMRADLIGLDGYLHAMWVTIPVERGIVLWPHDMVARLREYQCFAGERPGLDVWNPWHLTGPVARRRFAVRYGFDPVGDARITRADLLAPGAATPGAERFLAEIARRIDTYTDLAVVMFAPELGGVTVLPKSRDGAASR